MRQGPEQPTSALARGPQVVDRPGGLDAFNPDLQDAWIHPLLGPRRGEYQATLAGLRAYVSRVDSLDWTTSEVQLPASSVAGLEIQVLVAPRCEPRLDPATNASIARRVADRVRVASPGHVAVTTAWGAGHNIHIDRPDLVIASVRRLVALAR